MTDETSTSWLDDDEADAWLALVSILGVLPPALDAQLTRDSDLTFFEFLVLARLAEVGDEPMRLSDLAAVTHAALPRLSRVLAGLESDGLVVRQVSADDARSRHAHLTDAGWERLAAAAPGHVERVRELFVSRLTREQLGQMRRIGARVLGGTTKGSVRGHQGLTRFPTRPRTED